jgi:hypothetical protein
MSGGSFNYLCYSEPNELINKIDDLTELEDELIRHNYTDIAKDVRRLIEYVLSAQNRISVLHENLRDVFHAVEWYVSADIGEDSLIKELEKYRNGVKK